MKKSVLIISILLISLTGCSKYKSAEGVYGGCSYMRKVADDKYQVGYEIYLSKQDLRIDKITVAEDKNWKEFRQYIQDDEEIETGGSNMLSVCRGKGPAYDSLNEYAYYTIQEQDLDKVLSYFEKHSYTFVLKDKGTGELYLAESVWPLQIIEE